MFKRQHPSIRFGHFSVVLASEMNQIVKVSAFIKAEDISEAVLRLINNIFIGQFTQITKNPTYFLSCLSSHAEIYTSRTSCSCSVHVSWRLLKVTYVELGVDKNACWDTSTQPRPMAEDMSQIHSSSSRREMNCLDVFLRCEDPIAGHDHGPGNP